MSRTATTCSSGSPSEPPAKNGQRSFLQSAGALSASVLMSRILGFTRDIFLSAILGGGVLMSAWVQASGWANMFRQILGEGALGQAIVPILTRTLKEQGEAYARRKFTTLLIYLSLLLCGLTVLIALPLFLLAVNDFFTSPIWRTAALLTPIVMPYSIFICAVGVMMSCLNMLRVYFLPSLTAILQNIIIIGALYFLCPVFSEGIDKVKALSLSVLAAGIIEFLYMLYLLKKNNMQLSFTGSVWKDLASVKEIFTLALPGIVAAGAHIISTQCDRLIAGNIPKFAGEIGNYATSALYYSDRLVLLPVGVFAFAFGTVALTEMSHAAADRDREKFFGVMGLSMRNLLFLTLPMAFFMFVFSRELLNFVYVRGAFSETALEQTAQAFQYAVFGIPFFALLKVTNASFTAQKDMKTPFITGLIAIGFNIVLNFALMFPLRQGGIALATVLASVLNNSLLLILLKKKMQMPVPIRQTLIFLGKLFTITLCPFFAVIPLSWVLRDTWLFVPGTAAFYGLLYFAGALLFRMPELEMISGRILTRLKKKKT